MVPKSVGLALVLLSTYALAFQLIEKSAGRKGVHKCEAEVGDVLACGQFCRSKNETYCPQDRTCVGTGECHMCPGHYLLHQEANYCQQNPYGIVKQWCGDRPQARCSNIVNNWINTIAVCSVKNEATGTPGLDSMGGCIVSEGEPPSEMYNCETMCDWRADEDEPAMKMEDKGRRFCPLNPEVCDAQSKQCEKVCNTYNEYASQEAIHCDSTCNFLCWLNLNVFGHTNTAAEMSHGKWCIEKGCSENPCVAGPDR